MTQDLSFERFFVLRSGFLQVYFFESFLLNILMRFFGSINLFRELRAVEISRLVCSFLNRSEFLVNQFELINLLQ